MNLHHRSTPAVALLLTLAAASSAWGDASAFQGAQGFGADATGGRAGSIYVVTNLNDSGAGSFRDAVSQSNRIIVFAVSGQINLQSAVSAKSNLTILGQTAPGQGIAIQGREVSFDSQSNDIVQYMRFREGSVDPSEKASVNLGSTSNFILDHVSVEYAQYDNIDAVGTNGVNNLTIQNSILADPIKAQQFNMHTEGSNVTYLANVWANAHNRSPLAKSDTQFVNNVVYNYQAAYTTGDSGGKYSYDILNNYFMAGPSTSSAGDAWYQLDSNQSAYSSGNILDSNKNGKLDGSATTPGGVTTLSAEWSPTTKYLPTLTAAGAYAFTTAHAGDAYNNGDGTFGRDQVDNQILGQVESDGTDGYIYNTENSNGSVGFGTIPSTTTGPNTLDTVPFAWLQAHGLSTTNANDLLKKNAIGYTMIEQYAYEIADQYASQIWTHSSGSWVSGTWNNATPGAYDHAYILGNGSVNGAATISGADAANAFSLNIGGNGPAAGESLNVSGGSLNVQATITVGDQNNAALNISGGSVFAYNVQLGNTVLNADGSAGPTYTGTLNLTGGTLTLQQLVLGGGTYGAWNSGGVFNWNGGTLQAFNSLAVNVPATLGASGGIVDSNGYTGTLSGVLSGNGGLTKIGAGTIALSANNAYAGGTTISAGALRANTNSALGAGTVAINAPSGLQLANGVTLANAITAAPGANEFVDVPDANASATLSGNIAVSGGSNQYRLGISGTGATLTLTGASTASTLTILTRGNVVFSGNGSLISSSSVNVGRSSAASTMSLTLNNNALVQGNSVNLGGLNGTSDDLSTAVTLNDASTLSAGTAALNVNNSDVGGSTTLTLNGSSTLKAGSVTLGGSNHGQTTLNFNGGTLLATAGDSASPFFAATSASANVLAGGIKVNDGGFGITLAQPLLHGGSGTDGGLTKSGAGTVTLAGANTYNGATVVTAGRLVVTGSVANNTSAANMLTPDGASTLTRMTAAGASYDNWGSAASSDLQTHADLRSGSNAINNPNGESVSMAWRIRTSAETAGATGAQLESDVLALSGMANTATTGQTDPFALQLSYLPSVAGTPTLVWNNGALWLNAVLGDYASGAQAVGGVQSSWDVFASTHSITDANLGNYLGSWGYDPTGKTVWAVLDHNSDFAAGVPIAAPVPEPASLSLLALAAMPLLRRNRRRRIAG